MSYDTLKIVLWALMCVPVFAFGVWTWNNLLKQSLEAEKGNKRKKSRAQKRQEAEEEAERQAAMEEERARRKKFDEEYKETHGI